MNKMKIYSLSDPITKELKYIGKTVQKIENRYSSHISVSKNNRKKDYTHCWIKSLLTKGLKPEISILEENATIDDEVFYISYLKYLGLKLTNHTEGGDNGTLGCSWKVSENALSKYKYKSSKPIWQYDLNGIFIKEWESSRDFCRHYNLSLNAARNAIRNGNLCNGYCLTEKNINFNKPSKYLNRKVKVFNTIDKSFIVFNNVREASLHIKTSCNNCYKAIKGNNTISKKYKIKFYEG